mgnify:FL=1|tara:strand:- start:948 stop:1340 length:393 start_codon:yes stop_codon:yes gene_type:complete
MNKKLLIALVLFIVWVVLFFVPKAKAESPTQPPIVWDKQTVQKLIHDVSIQYGVSESVMNRVISCESTYNKDTIGDGGKSYGLVQIHQDYWGDKITIEQSKDPYFAVDFLADKLSKKQGHLWTCYRMYYN